MNIVKYVDKYIIGGMIWAAYPFIGGRMHIPKDVKRILVVKLWAIGDSINSLPLIYALKKEYPSAKITVLASKMNADIFKGQDCVDDISIFNIDWILSNHKRFDIGFDLEPYLNISALTTRYACKRCIGFDHGIRRHMYDWTARFHKDRHIVNIYMNMLSALNKKHAAPKKLPALYSEKFILPASCKEKELIGICPYVGFTVPERNWPTENYVALISRIIRDKKKIVLLIGSKRYDSRFKDIQSKTSTRQVVNLAGKTTVPQLCSIIGKCSIFISNDTGPMHMAAAQGVKTIGLFGPTTPKMWGPYGKHTIAIFHPKESCPFFENTHHRNRPVILTTGQKTCMDAITVDEVYGEYRKWIR